MRHFPDRYVERYAFRHEAEARYYALTRAGLTVELEWLPGSRLWRLIYWQPTETPEKNA
jgi:hypothetical protein